MQRALDLVELAGAQRRGLHHDRLAAVDAVALQRDLGVGLAGGAQRVADRVDRRGGAPHVDGDGGAAGEVDSEVQPADPEPGDGDEQERAREQPPAPRPVDEVEPGSLVEDVGEGVTLPGRRCGGRGHEVTVGVSRPAAMPTPRKRTRFGLRARSDTSGCMKK